MRVNFLKSKGLSAAEIVDAFAAVGDPQPLKKVEDIINNVSEEVARVERRIDALRDDIEKRCDAVEQQLKDCDMDKIDDVRKRCSDLLQQSATEKGNLDKRLAKLHHIDRLPHMQTRLNAAEDAQRKMDDRLNKLQVAVEDLSRTVGGGADDGGGAAAAVAAAAGDAAAIAPQPADAAPPVPAAAGAEGS
eukprot:gene13900-6506_t